MANEDLRVRISTQVQGLDQVESLKNAVRQLQGAATPAAADLTKLKNAAMALGSATGRTESDLRRSVNALKDVRAQLSITGAEYKKLTGTIDQYQRQLDKATGAQQRGGRAAQFGQTVGAVAASGVFGGPEGLVGAGIGAFFGPGGALAGGAIGAQVGMLRQQLGGTATLAADLEKQRIALRLILKDTAEYNSALEFLTKTSKDYAIPQDRLIKGFTQLAASVVGAGGNISDTKTAFEGVTAGIRGTGRSLEDLDGALLATAQVFSKGKVSAEELRGQIGERLPGAFTLFAEAIGKTPQELDKALERGEVDLQDFLTFAKSVFGEYGENAKIIAESPAAAGDRLQTSLKNLGESVGRLLQPIGSSFQDTFADIASYIDGAAKRLANFLGLNKTSAQKSGELNNLIITQQKAIERERSKLASGVTSKEAAEYSIKEFEANIARMRAELKLMGALDKAAEQQGKAAKAGLQGQAAPTSTADSDSAAKKAAAAAERLAAEQQRLNEATAKAQIEQARTVFSNQMELIRKRWDYEDQRLKMQRDIQAGSLTGIRAEEARAFNEFMAQREALRRQIREATLGVVAAEQNAGFNAQMEAVTGQGLGGGGQRGQIVEYLTGDRSHSGYRADHGGSNYHEHLAFKTAEQMRMAMEALKASGIKIGSTTGGRHAAGSYHYSGQAFDVPASQVPVGQEQALSRRVRDALANAGFAGMGIGTGAQTRRNVAAQGKLGSANAEVQQAGALQGLTRQNAEKMLAQQGVLFVQQRTQALRDETAQMERNNDLALKRMKLEQSGMRPELVEAAMKKEQMALDLMERRAQIQENIVAAEGDPDAIAKSQEQLAAVNAEYARQLELINALTQAQTGSGVALANYIGQLKLQLAEMTNIENVVISMAQTIESELSSAMSNAVNVLVSGSGSIKQTLADMFKSIGASFVQMATQIIAKQLIIIALNSIAKIFGGGGGGGGTVTGDFMNMTALGGLVPAANGASFVNGTAKFANGGIVSRPTFFKFANGGTMQNGVMGEAGPEAIMPLKRGADGKLGVSMRTDALNRYRPMGATGTMAADGDPAAAAGGAAPGATAIDVRYSVERINNVEYVTADQFRAGMQQAAAQGAQRGEQQTLRRLQTSASTRRRLGV